ncbi:hypothetical protein BZA05DRAFT_471625 [Tricharina praecox]|uniref:uncharacterized protein n=1 Tax=Tricharina praecox TaxID=43433 RepID=UPI00222001CC|nr:uncharacterized protein BZA05DRAFT_471625 [Tricharina praecox]KAI5856601.1 hypothetical protein BZA05DRAFT_471625 [Tricharina praecox]
MTFTRLHLSGTPGNCPSVTPDGADTSEDEAEAKPPVAQRETYTHERLCMIRFLRDDLESDWRSVARMYNDTRKRYPPPTAAAFAVINSNSETEEVKQHCGWIEVTTRAPAPPVPRRAHSYHCRACGHRDLKLENKEREEDSERSDKA